jgi:hypothetical protein
LLQLRKMAVGANTGVATSRGWRGSDGRFMDTEAESQGGLRTFENDAKPPKRVAGKCLWATIPSHRKLLRSKAVAAAAIALVLLKRNLLDNILPPAIAGSLAIQKKLCRQCRHAVALTVHMD